MRGRLNHVNNFGMSFVLFFFIKRDEGMRGREGERVYVEREREMEGGERERKEGEE